MPLHSEKVLQTFYMFFHSETRIIYQNNVYKVDSSNEAADAATHFEKHCKFLRTPSRLYQAAREEFLLLTKLDHFYECSSSVERLALLIAHIRENSSLVHALARLALQIQTNRRNWFRQLSTEANKTTLAAKLNVVQHAFDSVWI